MDQWAGGGSKLYRLTFQKGTSKSRGRSRVQRSGCLLCDQEAPSWTGKLPPQLLTPESRHRCHHLEAGISRKPRPPRKSTVFVLPLRHYACFSPPHQSWYPTACLSTPSKPGAGSATPADSAPGKLGASTMVLAWRNGRSVAWPHLYLPCLSKLPLSSGALAPLRKRYALLLGLWKGKVVSTN